LRVIDELEHLVEGSKSMPLTHHKIVDEDQFFVLTQRLKNALPEDIKKATELARKTASVVENANSEAKRMVTDAQNEAQHLVGDARSQADRAVEDARSRSERMIEDARREAERILADAQQHAEQLVADHTITQTATQAAEKTEQTALREAEDLRRQADDYAYDILDRTEVILNKLMTGVQQGKNQIQQPAPMSDEGSYSDDYNE
jgi:cell division septum initiation protein DivIVA